MNSTVTVSAINLFPVRSCAGLSLQDSGITPHGLFLDRNWRLLGPTGQFLTQRECPKMALVRPSLSTSGLTLDFPDAAGIEIASRTSEARVRVSDTSFGIDQGDHVADWLLKVLGVEARLLQVTNEVAAKDFAKPDMSPVLVISEESLADLNSRLPEPVAMNRFRPNIVVRGGLPYEEETWTRVLIGDVVYEASTEPCGRCVMVNIDQGKGQKAGKEPLRTLATYRRANGVVIFGKYMVAQSRGVVRLNDAVSDCAA